MTVTVIGHVLDYSTARPSAAAIKAAGYAGVIRYLAVPPNPKIITPSERIAFRDAGLPYALVWETTASRALSGDPGGRADGQVARSLCAGWWPADRPIYAAVDFNAIGAQIGVCVDYALAFAAASGHPGGIYGSYYVVETAAGRGIPYRWQTLAWSNGHISARIQLLQTLQKPAFPDTDLNLVYAADWGQLSFPITPDVRKDPDMRLIHVVGPQADPTGSWYLVGGPLGITHITSTPALQELESVFGAAVLLSYETAVDAFGALPA